MNGSTPKISSVVEHSVVADNAPTPRVEAPRRRSTYLEAARRVLSSSGREALTLRSIAREAGVTAPALYRHFKNLDALVAELSAQLWQDLAVTMKAASERFGAEAPLDALLAAFDAYVVFATERPEHYELLFARQPPGMFVQGATTPTRPVYLVIEEMLEACLQAGYELRVPLPRRDDLRQGLDPDAVLLFTLAHGRVALAASSQVVPFSDPLSSREFIRDVVLNLVVGSADS